MERIVSGGQTGADRAALDWAIASGIPHSGWCPKGRKAQDGPIDRHYQLTETTSPEYLQRTKWNVRDSDATVIFTLGGTLLGGSRKTVDFAIQLRKPWLHLSAEQSVANAGERLAQFIRENQVRVLNVAGSRESEERGVGEFVRAVLDRLQ